MEVPRLGIKLELQLLAYATATATRDPSMIYTTAHGLPDPLNDARDQTCVLMDASQIRFHEGHSCVWFLKVFAFPCF